MTLVDAHKSRLALKYGIDPEHPQVKSLVESGHLKSISSTEELQALLFRQDVTGTGIYIGYPNDGGCFTIRLDEPLNRDGKELKYLHKSEELNHLFVPSGLDLAAAKELIITEGELKSLCGFLNGLSVVALSGIWNWRTQGPEAELLADGDKLSDSQALISELNRDWNCKHITLLYDSDITIDHPGYPAFQRLAEQFYRLGAEEVKIVTLPSIDEKGKTGLDDFLLAKGEDGPNDLKKIIDRMKPYLPLGDGAETYSERLIMLDELESKLDAAVAYLGNKGEYICKDWLKRYIPLADDRKSLLRDAKAKLADIPKRKLRAKRSIGSRKSNLGSLYDQSFNLLQDTRYNIDERGNLCKMEMKKIEGQENIYFKPLCNFVPYPIRQISKDNGVEVERFLEVSAIGMDGCHFKPTIVPLKTFATMEWITPSWGAQASLEVGWLIKDEVRHCIQSMVAKGSVPEETVFTHLGWRKIGDRWAYLHAGGAIGPLAQVETPKRLANYILPTNTDHLKEALTLSINLLDIGPRDITIPLLSLVFLSPLCEPLRSAGIEPGFLMWLFGSTGSMKSTLAALFLSHFGRFDGKSLPASFRDTAASLESVNFAAKDSLMIVDDFYPAHNYREREKLEGVAQQLTRAYGDRTGRGRMNANMTSRASYPPRGMALATGEDLPHGESSLARHFVLELSPGALDKNKLSEAQKNKALLTEAMRGYLEWLAPQLDSMPAELRCQFEDLRNRAQAENRHPRLPEAVAHLFLGFNSILDLCISNEVLSEEQGQKLAEEAWNTLNRVAERQTETLKDQQPALKFLKILQELLYQKKVYLADLKNEVPAGADHLPVEKRIGWQGEGIVYLHMGNAFKEVYQYCKDEGELYPVQKNTLIKHIGQMNFFAGSQEKGRSIQKRFGDEKAWVVPIRAGLLEVD